MNDKYAGAAVTPPPERRPSLAEQIISSLNQITDSSLNVSGNLDELERYLFGDRPADKGNTVSSNPETECWENEVIRKLEHIKDIIMSQQNTIETISRFHK